MQNFLVKSSIYIYIWYICYVCSSTEIGSVHKQNKHTPYRVYKLETSNFITQTGAANEIREGGIKEGKNGKSSRNNSIDGARNRHANLSVTINIADTIQLSHP